MSYRDKMRPMQTDSLTARWEHFSMLKTIKGAKIGMHATVKIQDTIYSGFTLQGIWVPHKLEPYLLLNILSSGVPSLRIRNHII